MEEPAKDRLPGRYADAEREQGAPRTATDREFVEIGGLMSYASSLNDSYRLSGIYTGRILNGEKPADIPVMQATKFDLVIECRTLSAAGKYNG